MKMNLDCIRDVLLFIIDTQIIDSNLKIVPISCKDIYSSEKLEKYSQQEIFYSLLLLKEGQYISCLSKSYDNTIVIFEITNVTYKGHMFYESIRESTVWEQTKSTAKKIGNHTLEFVEKVAHDMAVEGFKAFISGNNSSNSTTGTS